MRRLKIHTSLEQTAGDERVKRLSQTPLIKTVNQCFTVGFASHLKNKKNKKHGGMLKCRLCYQFILNPDLRPPQICLLAFPAEQFTSGAVQQKHIAILIYVISVGYN